MLFQYSRSGVQSAHQTAACLGCCQDHMRWPCRWEKVQAKHSWNANWIATSAVTFRLQRHADHHLSASRPYQVSGLGV